MEDGLLPIYRNEYLIACTPREVDSAFGSGGGMAVYACNTLNRRQLLIFTPPYRSVWYRGSYGCFLPFIEGCAR